MQIFPRFIGFLQVVRKCESAEVALRRGASSRVGGSRPGGQKYIGICRALQENMTE
jgi:hypothetical protein